MCVGSSTNMTGLSLLPQGDWAEGRAAHNRGTMAAPLVLTGDTCNRIRMRTPGGTTWGDGTPPKPPQKKALSHSIIVTQNQKSDAGQLPVRLISSNEKKRLKTKDENHLL